MTIVGPEAPLGVGVADMLCEMGIPTAGPKKLPAQIETSKEFMRNLFKKYDIKGSLKYGAFNSYDGVEEFIDETVERQQEKIAQKFNFKMTNHIMKITGTCSACQAK